MMLVLSRKTEEAIRIGDDIVVTVLSIHKRVVRIGIEAPSSTVILRTELEPFEDADTEPKEDEQ